MESLEKPVGERVLQAMAQAYPDAVDLSLLSMVMGCSTASLQAAARELIAAGLAHPERPDAPRITDRGMLVADGLAADAAQANDMLERVEAIALRQLLQRRILGSRLPEPQADELRGSLEAVSDGALVDAAKVWAHQTVSDWRGIIGAMSRTAA